MPGFGAAEGATKFASVFVKNEGAEKALTENLGTKLKKAWLRMTGKREKRSIATGKRKVSSG